MSRTYEHYIFLSLEKSTAGLTNIDGHIKLEFYVYAPHSKDLHVYFTNEPRAKTTQGYEIGKTIILFTKIMWSEELRLMRFLFDSFLHISIKISQQIYRSKYLISQ